MGRQYSSGAEGLSTMAPSDLGTGQVYFLVAYEDENLTRMVVESYEYLGGNSTADIGGKAFRFRPIHTLLNHHSEVAVSDCYIDKSHLEALCDLSGLIGSLQSIFRDGPAGLLKN